MSAPCQPQKIIVSLQLIQIEMISLGKKIVSLPVGSDRNGQPHVSLQIETCQPQKMIVSPQVETCQPQKIIVSLMSASTDVSDWNGQPHRMIVSLSAGPD